MNALKPLTTTTLRLRLPCENGFHTSHMRSSYLSNSLRSHQCIAYRNIASNSSSQSVSHFKKHSSKLSILCKSTQDTSQNSIHSDSCSIEGIPQGGIVALGKFDALHIGHRSLVIQASQMGQPWLLSFSGMAEVLGWEKRLPLVAPYDRKSIISDWSKFCNDKIPKEYVLEFSKIRKLSAPEFIDLLADELQVQGVVAGVNYRFGYKAASDSSDLVKFCKNRNLKVNIVKPVLDNFDFDLDPDLEFSNRIQLDSSMSVTEDLNNQISSTKIRNAMSDGKMNYVAKLLGRRHRVSVCLSGASIFVFRSMKIDDSSKIGFDVNVNANDDDLKLLTNQLFDDFNDKFIPMKDFKKVFEIYDDDDDDVYFGLKFDANLILNQYPCDGCYRCTIKFHNYAFYDEGNIMNLGFGFLRLTMGKVCVIFRKNVSVNVDLSNMSHLSFEL